MQLFYQPDIPQNITFLDKEESRHCVKVLRKTKGDPLAITDGCGRFYEAIITNPNPKKCSFEIKSQTDVPPKDYFIHIAIAPTKQMDRLEWFVEKSVEIGIDAVSFIYCRHAERKNMKLNRLKKKAVGAMKQSEKAWLPEMHDPTTFDTFVENKYPDHSNFIAALGNNTQPLQKLAKPQGKYCLLVGPEGGFSSEEIKKAEEWGFHPVSLGREKLRTETAGIAGCLIFNLLNED